MKKLLFLTAIVSLLFVGCNNDNENYDPNDPSRETVRLLPLRIWYGDSGITFEHDEFNRLIRMFDSGSDSNRNTIAYNAQHNPVVLRQVHRNFTGEIYETVTTFQYHNNQVLIARNNGSTQYDTLTINANGSLEEMRSHNLVERYFYNTAGDLILIERITRRWDGSTTTNFIHIDYSDVKSIFRHQNAPNWFRVWFWRNDIELFVGLYHMPSSIRGLSDGDGNMSFSYELDADGYVRQMHIVNEEQWGTSSVTAIIEYVPAR